MFKKWSPKNKKCTECEKAKKMKEGVEFHSPLSLCESIVKKGNKYLVTDSEKTKVLGTHPSKSAALKQLAAIEASKARKAK